MDWHHYHKHTGVLDSVHIGIAGSLLTRDDPLFPRRVSQSLRPSGIKAYPRICVIPLSSPGEKVFQLPDSPNPDRLLPQI